MRKKISICDDSKIMLRQIAQYLEQLQPELSDELIPSYFTSGEEVLEGLPSDTCLLLLDISMEGMDGITCAKTLRGKGFDAPIIFITSLEEYSLEGYAVHAFGFLVKPVTYQEFANVVKEALALTAPHNPQTLPVRTADGIRVIDPAALIYAEVYKHETSFILENGRVDSNMQLASLEPVLLPMGFFRCHRGYIVSLKRIIFIGKDSLTMSNGAVIPLSKHRRKEFMDTYSSYMGVNLL